MSGERRGIPAALWGLLAFVAAVPLSWYGIRSSLRFSPMFRDLLPIAKMAPAIIAVPAGVVAVFLGGRWAVAAGSAFVAAGALVLISGAQSVMIAGLFVAAFGSGLGGIGAITLVSELHAPEDPARDAGFTLVALALTIGAMAGPVLSRSLDLTTLYATLANLVVLAAWPACRRRAIAPATHVAHGGVTRAFAIVAVLAVLNLIAAVAHFSAYEPADHTLDPDGFIQLRNAVAIGNGASVVVGLLLVFAWLRAGNGPPSSPGKIAIGMTLYAAGALLFIAPLQPRATHAMVTFGVLGLANICLESISLSLISRIAAPRLRPLVFGAWYGLVRGSILAADSFTDALAVLARPLVAVALAAVCAVAAAAGYLLLRSWARSATTAPTSVFE